MKLTLTQAKSLRKGQVIYALPPSGSQYFRNGGRNADGTPMRFRVTSIRTWVTAPEEIIVGLKRGLRDTFKIDQSELEYFTTEA